MARYRPVYTQIWNKQDIQQLSERQRLLFIYLFTNQHTTESGIYAITPITMAHETGIPLRFIEKVLKEFPAHMIKYDWKNHCVFVVSFMNYNRWGNPNIIKKSVIRDMQLTKTFLWEEFIIKYPLYFEDLLSIDKGLVTLVKGTNNNDNSINNDNSNNNKEIKEQKLSTERKDVEQPKTKKNEAQGFLNYFNLKTNKKLTFTDERKRIIDQRLKTHTLDQLKIAVDNFILDTWEDRHKFTDVVYCIGIRKGIDNLEKWLNFSSDKKPDPITASAAISLIQRNQTTTTIEEILNRLPEKDLPEFMTFVNKDNYLKGIYQRAKKLVKEK